MKRVYLRFASVSEYDAMRYFSARNHPVVTSDNFKIQKSIKDLPAMKIVHAYGLEAGPDDESEIEDRVHFIVENVPDDVLMLLMLAVGPKDHLEAW